jgi:putative transposase
MAFKIGKTAFLRPSFRIYPSNKQKQILENHFVMCKETYNTLLETSKKTYQETGKRLTNRDYNKIVKDMFPDLPHHTIYSPIKQDVGGRLDHAFNEFFRRCKDPTCKKKGFPRFKSRVSSITFPARGGFKFMPDGRLYCCRIGNISIVRHRLLEGVIKTVTIKKNRAGQWFAVFACEVKTPVVFHFGGKIGIDVGIDPLARLSDDTRIDNPRHLCKSEERLVWLQRRLSRKMRGSNNREKSRLLLARRHQKIVDQRKDFLHKQSHAIAVKYSEISVENLNIRRMLRNRRLHKHIKDASWNSFITMISYKAVMRGGVVIRKNPRNTSKTCSRCGAIRDMPLSARVYNCSVCGFVCDRDLNAAINIEGRDGLSRTNTLMDIRPPRQEFPVASPVDEVRTKPNQSGL